MKKSKMIVFALLLIAILVSISGTYAYYVDEANTKAKLEIANWIIKVNTKDITLEANHVFEVKDLLYNKGNRVQAANNRFAPGMILEFTVAIDATKSDVALEYDMGVDLSNFNNPNIVIKSVATDNGSINYDTETKKYHGTMDLARVKSRAAIVTVTLEWLDNDLHQEEDNALGDTPDMKIAIPVDVEVNQYVEGA